MQNCMPLHGSKPSQATPTPRSLLRQCRSHCFAGSGSNSCSHLVLMLLETMHFSCPRTGLLARRARLVERAWCKVAREAVGPEAHMAPQQWLVNTTAPGIAPDDRRRLDLVIYGAAPLGGALCCDTTLVSPLTRDGEPHRGVAAQDGGERKSARWDRSC